MAADDSGWYGNPGLTDGWVAGCRCRDQSVTLGES